MGRSIIDQTSPPPPYLLHATRRLGQTNGARAGRERSVDSRLRLALGIDLLDDVGRS